MANNKKILVYSYEDEISYRIPDREMEKVLQSQNMHHVGMKNVNIVDMQSGGLIRKNPKVENHPNKNDLDKSHWMIHASFRINAIVQVYSDGSINIIPK